MGGSRIASTSCHTLIRRAGGALAAVLVAMIVLAPGAQAVRYSTVGVDSVRDDAAGKPERRDHLVQVRNAAGERLHVGDDACERRLARAASDGLRLPDGWSLDCVGQGLDWEGGSHWGVTCPYQECPEGDGPYVSISNPTYYVVAHELCHANFGNGELAADACAAEHGASLESSPYS